MWETGVLISKIDIFAGYATQVERIKKEKTLAVKVLTVKPASVDSGVKLWLNNILMSECTNDYWHKLKIQGVYQVWRVWKY